ncbi:MAG TPA: translation factor GTPase family protein [Acidimicrobiia bacterium]|nr:translation factor GTPase family protein [Acidimicrobiia bacterium]
MNLGILAHVDAGKTTLTEQLLHAAGVIDDVGRVDAGTTTTDSLELERQRGITIKSAVASFVVDGVTVNLVDTPGHSDFIAEVERVLGVLDGAILVVSAVEGVQSQTLLLFRALRGLRIPTVFFLNKLDRTGADVDRTLDAIRERLEANLVPLGVPSSVGTPEVAVGPPDLSDRAQADAAVEVLAANDDDLLHRVVDETPLSTHELWKILVDQTANLLVQPVFFGAALPGIGVGDLLDWTPHLLPRSSGDAAGDASGTVFKIERGPNREKIALVRVFSGTLRTRDRIPIGDEVNTVTAIDVFEHGTTTRRSQARAGDIAKVHGLNGARIGTTFGDTERTETGDHVFSPPTLETAVVARHPQDKRAVFEALTELAEQDPLINLRQDDARQELFLSLYGEVQQEVIAQTLAVDYDLEIDFRPTTPVCIERPNTTGSAIETIPRSRTTDRPFLATIGLTVEPLPPGSGVDFELDVGIKTIPIHVFDSVDVFRTVMHQAVTDTLRQGLRGWQVTDCKVTMTDCDYQAPPRRWPGTTLSDYRELTPLVLMAALKQAGTTVCEPLLDVRLEFPEDLLGDILALLNELDAQPGQPTRHGPVWILKATIRAARLHDLQSRLPDMTRGEGVVESAFAGYQPVRGTPPSRPRTDRNPLDRIDYLRRTVGT